MKKLLAILCIFAIIINVYVGIYLDDSKEEWSGKHGEESETIDFSDFTVTVPEMMLGDNAQYDYTIYIELYWEDKNDGDWERYTLNANGQLITKIPSDVIIKKDGFNTEHSTVCVREETSATLSIYIESSDGEPVTIHGGLEGTVDEFTCLNEKIVIQSITDAHVEVDKIRHIPVPISFDGTKRFYPDPNLPVEDTIDDKIFLGNKMRQLGDNGSVVEMPDVDEGWVSEFLTQTYNWTVEGGEKVAGFKALIINITTGFFQDWMPFTKKVWIANEVPFPVKTFIRTNMSDYDENGTFYIIAEHTRTLQENGFTRGSKEIPWGSCKAGTHFFTRHPRAEFLESEYIPLSGSKYDSSSFDFKTEDAIDFALENSKELKRFVNKYDDVVIRDAVYKVVKDTKAELDPSGKAGSYNWNLSFGYKPTQSEIIAAWENDEEPNWFYIVNLTRNVTKETGIDKYSEEIKIINEYPINSRRWYTPYSRSELADETLTLASSEAIFKLDEEIKSKVFTAVDGGINFRDTRYNLQMDDMSESNMPQREIIESITGITLPRTKYSWQIEKGDFLAGTIFTATVDIETGQLQSIMEIEGTALYGLFS